MDDGSDCFGRSGEFFNPVLTMGAQVSFLLVISHFFQLLLKAFGPTCTPRANSRFVLGPSCLSHIDSVRTFFFYNSAEYYETMALYARIIIMYLIGLEIDFAYLRRNLRVATVIACGSSFICTIFAIAVTSFIYEETGAQGSTVMMTLTLAIILCNTASPFVTCLAHDLKFANSDLGRLAISSSLVADTYAVFLLIILSTNKRDFGFSDWLVRGILYLIIVITAIFLNINLADWLNRRQRNQKYLKNTELFALIAVLFVAATSLETMGISSIFACFILGVLLAFLMNLKGLVDLLALTIGVEDKVLSSQLFCNLMTAAVVINLLIWGPLIAYTVRRESDILGYKHIDFEKQCPESELKLLACVHSPRPVATMIGLIATCKGPDSVAISPYLMHLIELPEKNKSKNLLYHQKAEDELSDDDNYGGNDVVEINETVDIFCSETPVMISQAKVVAPYATMFADVCEFAEDVRASIIILTFHKHQRIDGKLESGKEGIRITNQKVLLHAKCTVAILIDRGLTAGSMHTSTSGSLHHIAMLFFGGQDDREALGFSKRLGMHHRISLTVIRFLHKSVPTEHVGIDVDHKEEDVLMAIPSHESEADADNTVLTDFFNRFVTSVGKGSRCNSTLTTGISDWEECPELGRVGDFLASPDFELCGSVLVVQQHRSASADDDQ
ncbi:hypothetical protein SASPL_135529 [Salvia splendens]|uniref:Cation/H+ exchanger domain-containing protein n=1 Tax=Salvia splendens TaxID=180675 RepID=A0A8X8WYW8_SALSN|nr:hypothetical protein SASPL_135529 [Salvia splendens]